jgi:hypothetical protein
MSMPAFGVAYSDIEIAAVADYATTLSQRCGQTTHAVVEDQ